jgi:hypothetical protein
MDPQRLKENFALVGGHGEDVAAYGVVSQVMVEAAGDAA